MIRDGKAVFQKVDTGITGATDIEVLSGLKEGDEIITGLTRSSGRSRTRPRFKVDNKTTTEQKT